MRYVTIPRDVVAVIKGQTITIKFSECLENWLDDRRVGRSHQSMRYAARIDAKMRDRRAGDEVQLEDSEWAMLSEVVREREPGNEYNAQLMRHALSLLDAVLDAPNDEERAKLAEESKKKSNSETSAQA